MEAIENLLLGVDPEVVSKSEQILSEVFSNSDQILAEVFGKLEQILELKVVPNIHRDGAIQ